MRVLIACEFSQRVTKAFREHGHEAYSCDLLPTEGNPDWHIQDDVLKHLDGLTCYKCGGMGWIKIPPRHNIYDWAYERLDCPICGGKGVLPWDLMIAHDPCTYQCLSGVRWLHEREGRWELLRKSCEFTCKLFNAPIPKIARENPIPHHYAIELIGKDYTQLVQPHYFGDAETKATCLWLFNLPELVRTHFMAKTEIRDSVHQCPPSDDRSKIRSRTFQGLANAMAEQWGGNA